MAEVKALFEAVFGTDSEDEDEEISTGVNGGGKPDEWQAVEGVDGLWRCERFLDPEEQASLVTAIENDGWFSHPSYNQVMRHGDLPPWAMTLSSLIFSSISRFVELGLGVPFREELLQRKPLFDQMIMNSYQPGEGIKPHVDLARFQDGIVVLSLLSSCVMRWRMCDKPTHKVDVLLSPGDLIVLSGNARYKWTHEINREQADEQVWEGKILEQGRRISVTLRKMCPE